uniref:LRRCT domain-containing protein n=1 Tax=Chelonoidis abingdonii TaxID=106734 RepID=A0A8C0JHM2_CHEAB
MSRLWIMVLVLLWIPVMAIAQLPGNAQCPVNCSCFFSQWFVRCSNASLSSLPPGIPNATVELDLQHNQFSTLSAGFFPELAEISIIYLGSSGIHQVEPGAFQGLSVLDLSNNLLLELSDQALHGLPRLRRLYLRANRITNVSSKALPGSLRALSLDENQLTSVPAAIRTSPMLSTLQLSGNPIRKLSSLSFGRRLRSLRQLFLDSLALEQITNLAFTRLRWLELLSLRNNSLESLPPLSSLKSLSTLYLTGNKWRCDCNLIWLRTWQKKVLRKERSPVECSSPEVLQGQLLVDIEVTTCGSRVHESGGLGPRCTGFPVQDPLSFSLKGWDAKTSTALPFLSLFLSLPQLLHPLSHSLSACLSRPTSPSMSCCDSFTCSGGGEHSTQMPLLVSASAWGKLGFSCSTYCQLSQLSWLVVSWWVGGPE